MSPFSLTGPQFLLLYVILVAGVLVLALWLRDAVGRAPGGEPDEATIAALGPYQAAYLRGGAREAVATAIATLVHRGQIAIESGALTTSELDDDDEAEAPRERIAEGVYRGATKVASRPALEGAVLDAVRGGATTIAAILLQCTGETRAIEKTLEDAELYATEPALAVRQLQVRLPALALLSLGAARVLQGLSNHRPVLFLLMLVGLACGLLLVGVAERRTRRGDRALRELADRNAALEDTMSRAPQQLTAEEVAYGAALFGVGSLGGALAPVAAFTAPPPPPSASFGDGGSSCGGSSCGGGCGGGGCGGCGG